MQKIENVPIVIVAYNRAKSLKRLLNSLSQARYPNEDIKLIISIDRNDKNQDVLEVSKNFSWEFGSKEIYYQKTNLGLRKHIIQCGLLSLDYGNVIILEDDLYVAENFYFFAVESLKFAKAKKNIAGVSLYNHQMNQHNFRYFSAIDDEYDNWYFQYAASWGQAWSKDQFNDFHEWYLKNEKIEPKPQVPTAVSSWSEKSWLKFFIAYMIEENKYFLYPKISFSTNFGDSGTHSKGNTMYQVPISNSKKINFNFSEIDISKSLYDAFYENQTLHKHLKIDSKQLCTDLYGLKQNFENKRFFLTSKVLRFKVIKSFGRSLKPHEDNIIKEIPGKDFYLYDTNYKENNKIKKDKLSELFYTFKGINYQQSFYIFTRLFKQRLITIFKR